MSKAHAIDRAAVHELLETTGNDPTFVIEFIDTYLIDSVALLETMQRSINTADAHGLRRAAHCLKSNSATFGARTLAAERLGMEHEARDGVLVGATARLDAIERGFRDVERELKAVRSELIQR